ncbi:MAG: tRNA-dihydrouridine synthase [Candidatus Woesearchaeota archaeon]
MDYKDLTLKRKKAETHFKGNLFLGSTKENIHPLMKYCIELGASAVFSAPLNTKSELIFEYPTIANITKATKTVLQNIEKEENIKAIEVNTLESDDPKKLITEVIKETTKPLIISIPHTNIELIDTFKEHTFAIHFLERETETQADEELIKKLVSKTTILVRAAFESPEAIYQFLKNTHAHGIIIGTEALSKPTIFEQAINYFEKGYYNKLTRKRREKVVKRFEELAKGFDPETILKFKQRFMEE